MCLGKANEKIFLCLIDTVSILFSSCVWVSLQLTVFTIRLQPIYCDRHKYTYKYICLCINIYICMYRIIQAVLYDTISLLSIFICLGFWDFDFALWDSVSFFWFRFFDWSALSITAIINTHTHKKVLITWFCPFSYDMFFYLPFSWLLCLLAPPFVNIYT